MLDQGEKARLETLVLANITAKLTDLEAMLTNVNDKWVYEDCTYRFYHQSFKVYYLQSHTLEIVAALHALLPQLPLNAWFMDIIKDGTGKKFRDEDNMHRLESTRPIARSIFSRALFPRNDLQIR